MQDIQVDVCNDEYMFSGPGIMCEQIPKMRRGMYPRQPPKIFPIQFVHWPLNL